VIRLCRTALSVARVFARSRAPRVSSGALAPQRVLASLLREDLTLLRRLIVRQLAQRQVLTGELRLPASLERQAVRDAEPAATHARQWLPWRGRQSQHLFLGGGGAEGARLDLPHVGCGNDGALWHWDMATEQPCHPRNQLNPRRCLHSQGCDVGSLLARARGGARPERRICDVPPPASMSQVVCAPHMPVLPENDCAHHVWRRFISSWRRPD
jgi:hypothetical protein